MKFCLRDTAGSPERARWLLLACSGSQSQRVIWFILPAHGASHIIMIGIDWTRGDGLYGNIPLDRVWFFDLAVLLYVFRDFCLKQGIEFIIFCLNQGIGLSIFVLNRISFLG